jgi:hypothetical protein
MWISPSQRSASTIDGHQGTSRIMGGIYDLTLTSTTNLPMRRT